MSKVIDSHIIDHAIEEYVSPMLGWSSIQKCQMLAQCIFDTDGADSLEIGVYAGRALLSMAFAHRHIGKGMAHGIDAWKVEETQEGSNDPVNDTWWARQDLLEVKNKFFLSLEGHLGIHKYINAMRMNSKELYNAFKDRKFGLIHIDGNHSETISLWDAKHFAPMVIDNGYLCFDDTNWPTTKKAQEWIELNGFTVYYDANDWKLYRKI